MESFEVSLILSKISFGTPFLDKASVNSSVPINEANFALCVFFVIEGSPA
jgi:hypothetical protein